jgi:hypothetical protein
MRMFCFYGRHRSLGRKPYQASDDECLCRIREAEAILDSVKAGYKLSPYAEASPFAEASTYAKGFGGQGRETGPPSSTYGALMQSHAKFEDERLQSC